MRKSEKYRVSSSLCSFPLEFSPPDYNFPFHTSKHLPRSPRNTKLNLWISEKSLRSGQTWYFLSWFSEVKYRTLRILILLIKSETPAFHSHRVAPSLFPWRSTRTFVNSITARRPLDHFSNFLFQILLSQVVIPPSTTLFLAWALWVLFVGFFEMKDQGLEECQQFC